MAKKFPELESLNRKFDEMVDATSAVKEEQPEKKPVEKKAAPAKTESVPKKEKAPKKEPAPARAEASKDTADSTPAKEKKSDADSSVHVTRAMGKQSSYNTMPKTFSINKEILDKLEFIAAMEKLYKGNFFNISGYVNSLLAENIDKTMKELGLTEKYEERANMMK